MKLKAIYSYPETKTPYSRRFYPTSVLQQAFKEKYFQEMNEANAIPVFTDTYYDKPIGCCHATLRDRTVELDLTIGDKAYEDFLEDYTRMSCTLCGAGNVNPQGTVESLYLTGAHFSTLNNLECKIIKED